MRRSSCGLIRVSRVPLIAWDVPARAGQTGESKMTRIWRAVSRLRSAISQSRLLPGAPRQSNLEVLTMRSFSFPRIIAAALVGGISLFLGGSALARDTGAVYAMTNAAAGNSILIFTRLEDGTLASPP